MNNRDCRSGVQTVRMYKGIGSAELEVEGTTKNDMVAKKS